MSYRKGKLELPDIPAATLADITFLLLIFFLVTTSMDKDSGLERRLPQWVDPNEVKNDNQQINERNVFVVLVNKDNLLLVENEYANIKDLRVKAKEFLSNPNENSNLSEKEPLQVPLLGEVLVSKGVISLRNDVGTQYGTYIEVQNELVGAINELREEFSKLKFGKAFDRLNDDEKDAVRTVYPQKISEAEPKFIGGK
jgi:biopolymer transport protein ExbD